VQPLQAHVSSLWLYSGAGDAARISKDLPVKDLEKLVRRFTLISKKSPVSASCRVEPFSATHTLPDVSVFLEFFCLCLSCLFCTSVMLTRTFIM
jgi:hypothetical protein